LLNNLSDIYLMREGQRKRVSSYDKTGGNDDYLILQPGETITFAALEGIGCIKHIWVTLASEEQYFLRKLVLRIYWDGEEHPSVEVPIGDFFGMGHAQTKNFSSALFDMSPENGKAFNCWVPMPFGDGARFEVVNEGERFTRFYFYIDYEQYSSLDPRALRFHAFWNRQNPTNGVDDSKVSNEYYQFGGENLSDQNNYLILEAEGSGHFIGCNVNIHNLRMTDKWNWYGEGDDMFFIDGEPWPPSLHGTGTEDYFNTAWCPQQEVCTPYHGIILGGGPNWSGKISLYRYHVLDPIIFNKSIRFSIESGHNNHRSDDWSSTAYWYQTEPHKVYIELPSVEHRLPLPDIQPHDNEERKKVVKWVREQLKS
jgi:hypothetical protein